MYHICIINSSLTHSPIIVQNRKYIKEITSQHLLRLIKFKFSRLNVIKSISPMKILVKCYKSFPLLILNYQFNFINYCTIEFGYFSQKWVRMKMHSLLYHNKSLHSLPRKARDVCEEKQRFRCAIQSYVWRYKKYAEQSRALKKILKRQVIDHILK